MDNDQVRILGGCTDARRFQAIAVQTGCTVGVRGLMVFHGAEEGVRVSVASSIMHVEVLCRC